METLRFTLVSICNLIFGIIGLMLGVRIVLKLLAANASTPVVGWAFNITDGLVYPFRGILPNITLGGRAEFDLVAFIALLGYSIGFYLVAAIITVLMHAGSPHTEERIVHDHM